MADDRDHAQRDPRTDALLSALETALPEFHTRVTVTLYGHDQWTDVFLTQGKDLFLHVQLVAREPTQLNVTGSAEPARSRDGADEILRYALQYLPSFLERTPTP